MKQGSYAALAFIYEFPREFKLVTGAVVIYAHKYRNATIARVVLLHQQIDEEQSKSL